MNLIHSHHGLAFPAWLGVAVLQLSSGLGCGPFFRETILETPGYIVRSPEFHFMDQFRGRLGTFATEQEREERACTLDREMAEMETIMASSLPDAEQRGAWLEDYRILRRGMLVIGDQSLWRVSKDREKVVAELDPRVGQRIWPEQLPGEVRIYLDGASHYLDHLATGNLDALDLARAQWKKLLDLAPDERRYRGVWAAWMLFRTSSTKDVAEEGRWLGLVRQLRSEGAADCQHFAEEATVILHRLGSPPEGSSPFQRVSATEQLRALARRSALGHSSAERGLAEWVGSDFAYSEDEAKAICEDEALVEMVNLAFVEQAQSIRTRSEPDSIRGRLRDWLVFLEANPPARSSEFALLAWAAYSLADFDTAKRCLTLTPDDDPAANWLRGKLAALDGRLDDSRILLASAAREVAVEATVPARYNPFDTRVIRELSDNYDPHDPFDPFERFDPDRNGSKRRGLTPESRSRGRNDQLKGDLALVQISESRYEEALESLLDTEHWYDTAYVAERLLSPEQVLTLARRVTPPHPDVVGSPEGLSVEEIQDRYVNSWWGEEGRWPLQDRFRLLVARKTARQGWFKDARPFFPPPMRDAFDHYIEARTQGQNPRLSKSDRAAALWKAARMHRSLGMAYFGYEIGPDHAIYGGAFDLADLAESRRRGFFADYWENFDGLTEEEIEQRRFSLPTTADERWSDRQYGPGEKPRFHYRYDAAQLAWEAAALLPANDDLAARILTSAGTWLKGRDAKSADRFYQELIARHPETDLGQEAEKRHWFPSIDIDYNDRFPPLR